MVETLAPDVLHDVIDRHACVRLPAGRVDVEMYVLVRILRLQIQDLGDEQVRDLVVDLLAQEDDAFPQEERVDVEGAVTTR